MRVVFEEGTWATWLYDLMKPHVTEVLECNTRKNAVRKGSKSDRIDARKLSEQLYMNNVKSVYHGERGLRMMKELSRSYLTITRDLSRVMNRLKALYRSWGIPCAGNEVYAPRYRAEWLAKIGEVGVRRRAEHYYQQLDVLRPLRQEVRKDFLAEAKKHKPWKLLRAFDDSATSFSDLPFQGVASQCLSSYSLPDVSPEIFPALSALTRLNPLGHSNKYYH